MENSINGTLDKRFGFIFVRFLFPELFSEFEIHGTAYNAVMFEKSSEKPHSLWILDYNVTTANEYEKKKQTKKP